MKAALLTKVGEALVIEDVPKPMPGYGEVVVRIAGAGVCHSDVHYFEGTLPEGVPYFPFILGHENAGYVEAVGPGVTAVKEGEAVVVYPSPGDGICSYCLGGNEQYCADHSWQCGVMCNGGYAEYMLVHSQRHLVKLNTLDPTLAATLTDAGFTGYGALQKALPFIDHETPVLVIGVGGLGSYAVKYLDLLTGSPIIAVDIDASKRSKAREYGATHVLDGDDPDLDECILALTDGRGVCASFDFVGTDDTLETIIRTTRPGGKACQIGLAGGTARINTVATMKFGLTFETHLGGNIKQLREVVALFEAGRMTPIPTELMALEDANEALQLVASGDVEGRLVLTP
jgi:alcohol dehydrogenase, propanol-preferring